MGATALNNRPDTYLEQSGTSVMLQSHTAARAVEMQLLTRMEAICSSRDHFTVPTQYMEVTGSLYITR